MDYLVLGPLEVRDDGRAVAVGGPRRRALLCLLLLRANEAVGIDVLVEDLWSIAPPAGARKAVQVYVSRLRGDIGAGALETVGHGYRLNVDEAAIDARRFKQLAAHGGHALRRGEWAEAAARLSEALALWRGPALSDFAYEPFAQTEIRRLEELRVECAEDRIEAELALGHHAILVSELEALVADHSSRERLYGQLMLALYRSGRQQEALTVYRTARSRLREELGVEPGPELRSLEHAVLNHDPRLALPPPPRLPANPDRRTGTLVGRARELAELMAALDDAAHGRGSVTVLSGEAGIGKSRLVEELVARAHERRLRVLIGRCWESDGAPPYWPWVRCVRSYLRGTDPRTAARELGDGAVDVASMVPELRRVLPELRDPPVLDPAAARFRLFDAVAALLRTVAATQPCVVVLEDFHAADAPSQRLLEFVAAELTDAGVTITVTVRHADPGGRGDFQQALAELQRLPAFRHLRLGGLARREVADLIDTVRGIRVSERLLTAMHERTGGHPLLVLEMMRLAAGTDDLEGIFGTTLGAAIPHAVRSVVTERLQLLPDDCRAVLEVASVIGREVPTAELTRASGLSETQVLEHVESALAEGILEAHPASARLRFSHALVREVLYDGLDDGCRRRLHAQVGQAIARVHALDLEPHLTALAHHFLGGGAPAKAAHFAERAAHAAAGQLAYEESARLFEVALAAHAGGDGGDAAGRCDLLLALGDARMQAGDATSARTAYLEAARVARAAGMTERFACAALGFGGPFVWEPEADPRVTPLLEEALVALGDRADHLRARLLARLACSRPYSGGSPTARRRISAERSLAALVLARTLGDAKTLAWTIIGRIVVSWSPDTLDELLLLTDEAIATAVAMNARADAANAHSLRSVVLMTFGDVSSAAEDLDAAALLASELKSPSQQWDVGTHMVELRLLQGRFEEAEAVIEHARRVGERVHPAEAHECWVTQRFPLLLEQGRLDEIRAELERFAAARPDEAIFRCVLARLYCELGWCQRAQSLLTRLVPDQCAAIPRDVNWLLAVPILAEVAAILEDATAAAQLYELLAPYATLVAGAPHWFPLGVVSRPLGLLAAVLGRTGDALRHFEDATQRNDDLGAHAWAAHARTERARLLLARGEPGDHAIATDLLAEAQDTYRRLVMPASVAKTCSLLADHRSFGRD